MKQLPISVPAACGLLAIPLCRETLLNKKEFYAILEHKSEDVLSGQEFAIVS